ncbi:FMN-dependent NADH-azoreductase [Acidisphaera rubrifaciens]|uniref:FMN dependent NADH:quinone oxidoreductase n=1 Tax=Acidisphaera rubrifaciens HS-AP3 TaxID=1231350 RepID=A0A0D6P8Z3_9PROT|nr:NAD(P)H-dependent oxidoreductase [Acidisphaera rubrifaciens]GAN77826.1 acyl carrier protein phosphodiesterase [Acidisphaera rubrifaciens HS-AP3]
MPHLLYVESSPRKQRSASIEVAHAFIDAWKARHPDGTVDTLDVWNTPLPEFDGDALDAKYAGLAGQALTPSQQAAWDGIRAIADRFHKADVIVIGVPMWNFGIPYKLKHLIDAISQKDVLFTFDERGLNGLLGGRRLVIVAARGIGLDDFPRAQFDFQESYMTAWGKMVGITDIEIIAAEKLLYGPDADTASRAAARDAAATLARRS